jgi:hypothetical protein
VTTVSLCGARSVPVLNVHILLGCVVKGGFDFYVGLAWVVVVLHWQLVSRRRISSPFRLGAIPARLRLLTHN